MAGLLAPFSNPGIAIVASRCYIRILTANRPLDGNCKEMVVIKTASFDGGAFFAALDAERQARHCTWKQVAEECGISASTLSRMSRGKHPDVNSLAALAAWSGLDVDRFVRSAAAKEEPEPLAVITSCLRSDPRLNEEAAVALDQMVKAAYRSMTS